MSQENLEIVLGVFEAMNSRDFVAALDAHAEDVTLAVHGEFRHLGGASGKKAYGQWFGDWYRQFSDDYRSEIEEARGWGDRVLVVTNHRAKGRASGVPISQQTAEIITVSGGKIVRQEFFASRDEALQAAGLQDGGG